MELSVVDPRGSLPVQAATMAAACERSGFFRIPLDVIEREVAAAAWDSATAFFALPATAKRAVEFPEPGYPYGYAPLRYETLAKSLDDGTIAGPDLKESLSVGPDCGEPAGPFAEAEAWIRSPSLWPLEPPGLRAAWTAYYRALAGVAADLMRIMAVALDLPPDHFDALIDRPITSMRAIHYPRVTDTTPADRPGPSLRAGAHSDYGTLTILRTDDVRGLQIQADDGAWRDIEPEPDTFVVNLGDSIAQWTNDRWRSTLHRVAITDDRPRQSFAFFHMANWDARIECLPTCLKPGETPRHAPALAGPWLMRKFQSTVS